MPWVGTKKEGKCPTPDHYGWFPYHRYDCCNRWKKQKRSAIVVTMWVPHFSDRSAHIISQRSLKSGFYMIATIAECFFFSDHSDRSNRTETSLYFQYFSVVYPFVYPRSRCSFALMPLISNTPNCVHDSSFWFNNYSLIYVILTCTIHVFILKIY